MQSKRIRAVTKRRSLYLLFTLLCFGLAIIIALKVFEESMILYFSPSELIKSNEGIESKTIRVGGLVVKDSIKKIANNSIKFTITDFDTDLEIIYSGIIPSLFAEEQGTVALGKLNAEGVFIATELLAKHDENYMPKEVATSLKKSGRWQEFNG